MCIFVSSSTDQQILGEQYCYLNDGKCEKLVLASNELLVMSPGSECHIFSFNTGTRINQSHSYQQILSRPGIIYSVARNLATLPCNACSLAVNKKFCDIQGFLGEKHDQELSGKRTFLHVRNLLPSQPGHQCTGWIFDLFFTYCSHYMALLLFIMTRLCDGAQTKTGNIPIFMNMVLLYLVQTKNT